MNSFVFYEGIEFKLSLREMKKIRIKIMSVKNEEKKMLKEEEKKSKMKNEREAHK